MTDSRSEKLANREKTLAVLEKCKDREVNKIPILICKKTNLQIMVPMHLKGKKLEFFLRDKKSKYEKRQ